LKEQGVVKALVENLILMYGFPQVILSDCGASFLSKTFKNVAKF
jgi:hypothetical protein